MATCHPLLAASTTVTSASPFDSEHVSFPPSKRLKLDHDGDEGICEATPAKFTINVRFLSHACLVQNVMIQLLLSVTC